MAGVTCPHCGTPTSYTPVEHAKQAQMGNPGQWSQALLASGSVHDEESGWFFGVAKCQVCYKAFPVRGKARAWQDPDKTIVADTLEALWPLSIPAVHDDVPANIKEALTNGYLAAAVHAYLASLLVTKTALERTWKAEGASGIDHLVEKRSLPLRLGKQAHEIRHLANIIDHEDPKEDTVTKEDAEEMLEFARQLTNELYVEPGRLERATARRKALRKSPDDEGAAQE